MLRKIVNKARYVADTFIMKHLAGTICKSSTLTALYYLIFNPAFFREQKAVLAGKAKHVREAKETKNNYFLLVRNTHRIEKGLLMRPKRPIFAKEYIDETMDSFEGIWAKEHAENNPQLKWFHDVLSEYFSVVTTDSHINELSAHFKNLVNGSGRGLNGASTKNTKSIPYMRSFLSQSKISYDEFYSLVRQRRSVRWFLDKPVDRALIDKAIVAANQAPSACNRQPYEFRIFDAHDKVQQAVQLPMGTRGYGQGIPILIVLVGNLDAYFDDRDRHVIYIDASLASMSFMLALETLGLGSCAINWPDIEDRERKMEKFLELDRHQRPLMCIGVGYPDPDGLVAYSEKRPLGQLRKYN